MATTGRSAAVADRRMRPRVSFELFPPRSDAAALALGRTIDRLAGVEPAFMSVTFGAGGSSRDCSLTVLRYLLEHTAVEPMAHLTCVGSSHAQANRLVREFLDAGITSFLALRGDHPAGADLGTHLGDLGSAAELVRLIHRVLEEREPFAQGGIPGLPGVSRICERRLPERVAIAAFPTGHPRSTDPSQDIDALLAKGIAGANLAITQLFWRADDYLGYVERARAGGVSIPILPGIMPVTSPARLARLTELTGVEPPTEFAAALERTQDPVAQAEIGTDHGARLAAEVLEAGAPGLHVYTFNRELPEHLDAATAEALTAKTLVAGVIDGRNVWRGDLERAFDLAEALRPLAAEVAVSTSTSLLHVPHDVDETALDARLVSWLAFADQKVAQVATLERSLVAGRATILDELAAASAAFADRGNAPGVRVPAVRDRLHALAGRDLAREPYDVRVAAQASIDLPWLPTTTIASFAQTAEIRRARAGLVRGELAEAEYRELMRDEVERVIRPQERIGLDVLVHGEPERNDMVQYFAELLDGFAVTQHGWVQSYGSRCTRPSLLWGDVSRPTAMTVEWSAYAQSFTEKPVKGRLTGPVTILAWSFVRDDQPLDDTARQVALALRDEIADLESAGIRIIQVDEPALRELLPLKFADHDEYLDWLVGSFRLATGGAAAATQVHTHLCYSEFGVVIDAIRNLDADVTSIEAARSRMEVVDDVARSGFDHGIYDIHSPRVPGSAEVRALLERAAAEIPAARLWVNPDCGLKTRGYEETVASLEHMVEATLALRAERSAPAIAR